MREFLNSAAIVFLLLAPGCGRHRTAEPEKQEITVAAAANLAGAFDQVSNSFTKESGIRVVLSYAATAQLAQQIENGAPFDVFAAADTEHVDKLIREKRLVPESRAIYGRGQLALWIPKGDQLPVKRLADVAGSQVRFIAIANPSLAPYGEAAVELLRRSSLWPTVESKVVYAPNVNATKQLAATGNADVAFTAYSLVRSEKGAVLLMDGSLHAPLDQAMAIVSGSTKQALAKRFSDFILGPAGRRILSEHGYLFP